MAKCRKCDRCGVVYVVDSCCSNPVDTTINYKRTADKYLEEIEDEKYKFDLCRGCSTQFLHFIFNYSGIEKETEVKE